MRNDILNLEEGQLHLNLSISLDGTYSSCMEAPDALNASLGHGALSSTERLGRPFAVHPSKMMVLLIYAYMNGYFSSWEIGKGAFVSFCLS